MDYRSYLLLNMADNKKSDKFQKRYRKQIQKNYHTNIP